MKQLLGLVLACLFLAINSPAQDTSKDPATREEIETYLQTVRSHEMMINMMSALSKPIHQMLHDEYLKDKDSLPPDFEERASKKLDDLLKNMPFDEMMEATVPTYQKHFTKQDIEAMLAFYDSPTGQKLLTDMPAIMSEAMQAQMPIMMKYMDSVKQRMQEEVDQSLKKSSTPR